MFTDSMFQRSVGSGGEGSGGAYTHPQTHPASIIAGIVNIEAIQGGKRITINDTDGAHVFEIMDNTCDGITTFAMPKASIPYAPTITVAANTMSNIATLTGAITITLGDGIEDYDNEWDFVIEQGATAQTITLPAVVWGMGIAPTFAANSVTIVRLYYIGDTLRGEWTV